tara:strand:+ start:533 stop:1081 length:549 start_codon:yes stop_codon:yes gene_type:complete
MTKQSKLDHEVLLSRLNYQSDTGIFTWIDKEENDHHDRAWNKKYAGIEAGTTATLMGKKYRNIQVNKLLFLAHRLAWFYVYGYWPDRIDHIDGDGLNNKIDNLRDVTAMRNQRNRRMSSNNKSGVMGVCWDKKKARWKSYITVNSKTVNIGYSDYLWDAICERKSAESKLGFHENHGSIRPL